MKDACAHRIFSYVLFVCVTVVCTGLAVELRTPHYFGLRLYENLACDAGVRHINVDFFDYVADMPRSFTRTLQTRLARFIMRVATEGAGRGQSWSESTAVCYPDVIVRGEELGVRDTQRRMVDLETLELVVK